jgi:hypothetical protein
MPKILTKIVPFIFLAIGGYAFGFLGALAGAGIGYLIVNTPFSSSANKSPDPHQRSTVPGERDAA